MQLNTIDYFVKYVKNSIFVSSDKSSDSSRAYIARLRRWQDFSRLSSRPSCLTFRSNKGQIEMRNRCHLEPGIHFVQIFFKLSLISLLPPGSLVHFHVLFHVGFEMYCFPLYIKDISRLSRKSLFNIYVPKTTTATVNDCTKSH